MKKAKTFWHVIGKLSDGLILLVHIASFVLYMWIPVQIVEFGTDLTNTLTPVAKLLGEFLITAVCIGFLVLMISILIAIENRYRARNHLAKESHDTETWAQVIQQKKRIHNVHPTE